MQGTDLTDILAELSAREPIFHRREFGTSRAALEAMTAEDFWEVGASGAVYARETAIETMVSRYAAGPEPHDWPCRDFAIREAGADHYLVTYQLDEPGRPTRRSTLWRRSGEGWEILYHQGTVIAT